MKITGATLQPYSLPLARPLTIGAVSIATRQGIVLTVQSETGQCGYGEISPLPGLHRETLPEVAKKIPECLSCLKDISLSQGMLSFRGDLSRCLPPNLVPSLRSGVEMAIFDLLLQADSAPNNLPPFIPVNALLMTGENNLTEQVEKLLSQGFESIKIKVGRQSVRKDIEDITKVQSILQGGALLRLDANRQWTLPQARQFCDGIDLQGIEYIEEPTQNPIDHVCLSGSRIPIALDETLVEKRWGTLDKTYCSAVILKPSVLGGFEKTAQIVRWAQRHGILPVMSSAFQTSLATRMYVLFAALNGITQIPLGLDTGKWFCEDLLFNPCVIEKGKISLSSLSDRPELRVSCLGPKGDVC